MSRAIKILGCVVVAPLLLLGLVLFTLAAAAANWAAAKWPEN